MRSTVVLIRPQAAIVIARDARMAGQTTSGGGASVETEDRREEGDRDHPAEHEHVAVGEVDQLEDAVDEGVAERDEPVDGAVRDADQERREELVRGLDQVDDEPDDQEDDERRARSAGCGLIRTDA